VQGELNLTKNTQLRGQALLDKVESCLKQLSSEKEGYIYNASELSRAVGCSRPTLNKHTEFIDKILNKINAGKRIKKDHPLVEHLHTRIDHLELEKEALGKELNALRTHHAKIYSVLYMNSVDGAILIKEDTLEVTGEKQTTYTIENAGDLKYLELIITPLLTDGKIGLSAYKKVIPAISEGTL